jgi:hypothetical protein
VPHRSGTFVRTFAHWSLGLAAATSTGCYRYAPIEAASPPLGTEVRLQLTDAGAVRLGPVVGNRIDLVDGRVAGVADSGLTLSVTGTIDRLGVETTWKGEQVTFPNSAVATLGRRTLDRKRSYVAGGIAAGIVAVAGLAFNIAGNSGGGRAGGSGSPK